jgi:hypothetical protein
MTIWCLCPWSRPEFFDNVVQNFEQQTFKDSRLLLVANGAAKYLRADAGPRVTTIFSHVGLAAPMNEGLRFIRQKAKLGDWFCKWDDDDYYGPNYLSDIARIASAGFLATGRRRVWMRTAEGRLWKFGQSTQELPHGPTLAARVDLSVDFPETTGWGEDTKWVEAMQSRAVSFLAGPVNGFCWMRYASVEHGHAYGLSSDAFRMLGADIKDYGEFDLDVVNGNVSRPGTPISDLPMDVDRFMSTLLK